MTRHKLYDVGTVLSAIQRQQCAELQAKIDAERSPEKAREDRWLAAKAAYLQDGDIHSLKIHADAYYSAQPFFGIAQAVTTVAVEIATLVAERHAIQTQPRTIENDCE